MTDRNLFINTRGRLLDLNIPKVMGILNINNESFFDGGKYTDVKSAVHQVQSMLDDGADIIDVGGVSTKPGMSLIAADDEWKRVRPFLQALITEFPNTVFSIDTYNSLTAEKCVENGFAIINDISGGRFDDKMFETVAHLQVPYILMHSIETPETMQNNPQYNDVVQEVYKYFSEKINLLHQKGVNDIIIDLGFGFGKSVEHNYQLLKSLDLFAQLGKPILCGMSRKSMINKVLNINALDALNGTTVLNTIALLNGCNILRVHDVKQATEAVKLVKAYRD